MTNAATNDIAVIGFAQSPNERHSSSTTNGVEMLVPLFHEVLAETGLQRRDIGFWCSGSSDYLAGRAFSFVSAVDAIGAFPPIVESHVEMDGAWALYEAYVKLLMGEADTAIAYGFGKSSAGDLRRILALQLDPYLVAPLWPDSVSIAALQARLCLDSGLVTELQMAETVARSREHALADPKAQLSGHVTAEELLTRPYLADPLRAHDCAPISDGAAAVVLARGDVARRHCRRPAWITGFAHRIDPGALGLRDLTRSPSAVAAAADAELDPATLDVAELHAPFSHQELLLIHELGLGDRVRVNPSGGVLAGNPMFSAGLARIGAAARHVMSGQADRAAGHATSGPALQQNLFCVLGSR